MIEVLINEWVDNRTMSYGSNHGSGRASPTLKRLVTMLSSPCVNHLYTTCVKKLRSCQEESKVEPNIF